MNLHQFYLKGNLCTCCNTPAIVMQHTASLLNLAIMLMYMLMRGSCLSLLPEIRNLHDSRQYNITYLVQSSDLPDVANSHDRIPDEQRLLKYIIKSYERSVRPVRNASTPVRIKMGLTMTQIFDMDEKNQVLVTNVWLDQEWEDEFLRWDPQKFSNISMLRIPCDKIWLPDIVLYNNAAEYTDGLMPANAMVHHSGNIFWPVPTKLQSSCKVDVTYFPFDEQVCKLKFGSWTYDGFQVDITNRTSEVDFSNYVNNGEWELLGIKIVRNVVYYACCPEPFPDVTFFVHIRRRILYYMYNVIFPCIMMSALTLLVFCLPPDSGEKIALGITVLLAFSVFMLAVAENLPETSEFVPLISIYLTIVMALTSISVIMTVFVLNLHHRGPSKHQVPRWIRDVFINKLSTLLCLRSERDYPRYYSDEEKFIKNISLKITLDNIQHALQNELQMENGTKDSAVNENASKLVQSVQSKPELLSPHQTETHKRLKKRSSSLRRTNEEILQSLKKILEKHEKEDRDYEIIQEWRRVAQVVDRILFWIFFIGTLTSTLAVLVIVPATRTVPTYPK